MHSIYRKPKKWLPWQHPIEHRYQLCPHRIAWPQKPTPRIKQRVASCHMTKAIAHKASYSKLRPKNLVAMATSLSTSGPPFNTIPTAHPSAQPKRHLDQFSRFCTDDRRVSLYFTINAPFAPQFRPMSVVAKRLDGSRCHLVQATCQMGTQLPPQKGAQRPPLFGPCLL